MVILNRNEKNIQNYLQRSMLLQNILHTVNDIKGGMLENVIWISDTLNLFITDYLVISANIILYTSDFLSVVKQKW